MDSCNVKPKLVDGELICPEGKDKKWVSYGIIAIFIVSVIGISYYAITPGAWPGAPEEPEMVYESVEGYEHEEIVFNSFDEDYGWAVFLDITEENYKFDYATMVCGNPEAAPEGPDSFFMRVISTQGVFESDIITIEGEYIGLTYNYVVTNFTFDETVELEVGETATIYLVNPSFESGEWPPRICTVIPVFATTGLDDMEVHYVGVNETGYIIDDMGNGGDTYLALWLNPESKIPITETTSEEETDLDEPIIPLPNPESEEEENLATTGESDALRTALISIGMVTIATIGTIAVISRKR